MKLCALLITCLVFFKVGATLFFTPQMIATHLQSYTPQEIELIEKDLAVVRSVCLSSAQAPSSRFYLATAGAPGARKTTILEKFVAVHPEYQRGVYIDPDPRTLRFMVHTYYAESLSPLTISQAPNFETVIQNAYNRWRAASNYIVLTLFEEAVGAGQSVVYGTTSTGAHIPHFLAKLKENGYRVVLLLCSCSDNLRYKAVEYRNQTVRFCQSSPEDAISKGKFFPQRMQAYFDHADELYFYWSDDLFSQERLAATWQEGELKVLDSEAMQRFENKYEEDRAALKVEGISIPSFNSYFSKF